MPTVSGWDKADVIISGIAAGLSLGAVLVALWVASWRARWNRPKLALRASDSVAVATTTGSIAVYQRLLVENAAGRDDAEDVQVIVERYSPRHVPPGQPELPGVEHLRIPLAVTNSDPTVTRTVVPSGYGVLVDLLAIGATSPDWMHLQVRPEPAGAQHRLFVPTIGDLYGWSLDVVLLARGVPHRRYKVTIKYDGAWHANLPPSEHLSIEVRAVAPSS